MSFDPEVTMAELRLFVGRLAELAQAGRVGFLSSWRDQEAAQMLVTKLAEAAARLPPEVTAARPEVPWTQLRGMRNRLVHAYHATDPEILWITVSVDAPWLLERLPPPAPPPGPGE
jgi:uncharacterized protein with HEPN domain